jgi:hypothetical protein
MEIVLVNKLNGTLEGIVVSNMDLVINNSIEDDKKC